MNNLLLFWAPGLPETIIILVIVLILFGANRLPQLAKGMGETQLANQCANGVDCSDAEHKQNRRTIFKLIYQ